MCPSEYFLSQNFVLAFTFQNCFILSFVSYALGCPIDSTYMGEQRPLKHSLYSILCTPAGSERDDYYCPVLPLFGTQMRFRTVLFRFILEIKYLCVLSVEYLTIILSTLIAIMRRIQAYCMSGLGCFELELTSTMDELF